MDKGEIIKVIDSLNELRSKALEILKKLNEANIYHYRTEPLIKELNCDLDNLEKGLEFYWEEYTSCWNTDYYDYTIPLEYFDEYFDLEFEINKLKEKQEEERLKKEELKKKQELEKNKKQEQEEYELYLKLKSKFE